MPGVGWWKKLVITNKHAWSPEERTLRGKCNTYYTQSYLSFISSQFPTCKITIKWIMENCAMIWWKKVEHTEEASEHHVYFNSELKSHSVDAWIIH